MIDCNVLIAAARGSATCRLAVVRAIAAHELVISEPVLAEYREVGARPKHRTHVAALRTLTEALASIATMVEPAPAKFGLADPDDEVYLATALAGGAEALVTGNWRHFVQDRYGSIEVLSPCAFLDRTNR